MTEAMGVCANILLLCPGAPFRLGNFLSSMCLNCGAPTFAMPESSESGELQYRCRGID
jgi:trimethylamine--corrinoid protein Co-methyltransferase